MGEFVSEDQRMITCMVCGKEFLQINGAHLKTHEITGAEYREMFPNAKMVVFSNETRGKISDKLSGRIISDDVRKNMADALIKSWKDGKRENEREYKKNNPFFKGHYHTAKSRKMMSESHTGVPLPKSVCEKISKANSKPKEYQRDPEWRKSVGWNDRYIGMPKMKKHKPESIEKIKIARRKQVLPTKDTKIEVKVQNELLNRNIKFEKHYPIKGIPDIFIKNNGNSVAIFVDGCYWHGCPLHHPEMVDKRNSDLNVTHRLEELGIRVLRFWEHEINSDVNIVVDKIEEIIYG